MIRPLLSDDALDLLLQGIGTRLSEDDMDEEWLVPDLIHPGITCVMGQPERGKTTLLISLCKALLDGATWLGKPTKFPTGHGIVYLCEDRSTAQRVRRALEGSTGVHIATLQRWETGTSLAGLIDGTSAALVIIDSIYPAVGDVNEQARADVFLSAIQTVNVPVVLVHHEAKAGGSGTPAGVQRFRAAYRQTLRVRKSTAQTGGVLHLTVDVSGNDIPGKTGYSVLVNRDSLTTALTSDAGNEPVTTGSRRRSKVLSSAEKATTLGRLASNAGLSSDRTHTEIATVLLGGVRGKENKNLQAQVAQELGNPRGSIGHQRVATLIQEYPAEFAAGYQQGGNNAA